MLRARFSWQCLPLPLLGRKVTLVLYALARFGHPRCYGVAPTGVMRGLLMSLRGLLITVDLIQDKPLGIVGLLKHVKSQIAGLLDCVGGVFARGRYERLNMLGLYLHLDTSYKHSQSSSAS